MINNRKIIGIITARGGSKGLPGKNILEVGGKPLIAWTIEEAKKSRYIDRLILSSDDKEIINVARNLGCEVPFIRPIELAQDVTPGVEPVLHAITTLPEKYTYVVLLQPTSPLRKAEDIDGCINFCVRKKAPACVSVTESAKSPSWMFFIKEEGKMIPVIKTKDGTKRRRQDLPKVYVLNGGVYVADIGWLMMNKTFVTEETIAYKMDRERSLDIDSKADLKVFNAYNS